MEEGKHAVRDVPDAHVSDVKGLGLEAFALADADAGLVKKAHVQPLNVGPPDRPLVGYAACHC